MEQIKPAIIEKGWVVCPVCGKRQFKIQPDVTISNLEYRCKTSRRKKEHFMLINYREV